MNKTMTKKIMSFFFFFNFHLIHCFISFLRFKDMENFVTPLNKVISFQIPH